MVIRPLRPLNAIRYRLSGGAGMSNRAYTLDSLGGEQRRLSVLGAARLGLALQSGAACGHIVTDGGNVVGLATARRRSGPRSWEVHRLLLEAGHDGEGLKLIEMLGRDAAAQGGERVFVKLRYDDPLIEEATAHGLVRCSRELVYAGVAATSSRERPAGLRRKSPSDEHDLFRLYNAATPSQSRFLVGVTFDQWLSSRERGRGRERELVFDAEGQIRGWVRTWRSSGTGTVQVIAHPDHAGRLPDLVDFGLLQVSGAATVFCPVPVHELAAQSALSERGLKAVGEYVTLAMTMVVPERDEKSRRAARVAST